MSVLLFPATGRIPDVSQLNYLSVVHPMQGFAVPRHLLWLVIGPSLLLPQTFSEQLVFGCHLADVLLDVLGFILYGDLNTHQALSTLFPAGVQSLGIRLGVEACIELANLTPCLDLGFKSHFPGGGCPAFFLYGVAISRITVAAVYTSSLVLVMVAVGIVCNTGIHILLSEGTFLGLVNRPRRFQVSIFFHDLPS